MKINKFTAALVAMGMVSMAGVAYSQSTVYLTGSTAIRSTIFKAMTTSGAIFNDGSASSVISPAPNNTSSANQVVFEGHLVSNGDLVIINCSFTGSEAGIASVAGQGLTQTLPLDPNNTGTNSAGVYQIPGVGSLATFLNPASGYATNSTSPTALANISGAPAVPDLTMADTSQAVSRTPKSSFPLTDYGIVGAVTFTFMKGYEQTPDPAWNDVVNVTSDAVNLIIQNGNLNQGASILTGVAADSSDGIAIIGRNFGSGTRVNTLLNAAGLIPTTTVDQWTFSGNGTTSLSLLYPAATPGVLTFPGNVNSGQKMVDIGNDGYDSGKYVGYTLNVDGTGSGYVLLGYLGLSDAKNAAGNGLAPSGHAATYLPFNGVYEGDAAIENGAYPFWGYEHVLGTKNPSIPDAAAAGNSIVSGLVSYISAHDGAVSGNVSNGMNNQSPVIPCTSLGGTISGGLQVTRNGLDYGYPH